MSAGRPLLPTGSTARRSTRLHCNAGRGQARRSAGGLSVTACRRSGRSRGPRPLWKVGAVVEPRERLLRHRHAEEVAERFPALGAPRTRAAGPPGSRGGRPRCAPRRPGSAYVTVGEPAVEGAVPDRASGPCASSAGSGPSARGPRSCAAWKIVPVRAVVPLLRVADGQHHLGVRVARGQLAARSTCPASPPWTGSPSSAASRLSRSPSAALRNSVARSGSSSSGIMCMHGPKPSCSSADLQAERARPSESHSDDIHVPLHTRVCLDPKQVQKAIRLVRRSTARNIASVPCRCGHSCTVGPVAQAAACPAGSSGRASTKSTATPLRRAALGHRHLGLHHVRRAGHVGRPRRPGGPPAAPRRAAPAAAGSAAAGRPAAGASAPPAGGAASPARCTARRPAPGRSDSSGRSGSRPTVAAVGRQHGDRQPAVACSTSRARCSATSTAVTSAPRCAASAPSSAGLAARAGAQVEPAGVRCRRSARRPARPRPAGSPRPGRAPGRRGSPARSPGAPPGR